MGDTVKKYVNMKLLAALVLLGVAFCIPFTGNRRTMNILIMVLIFIALGESWNLLSGLAGMFSVTHSIFFGLGVYGMALCCGEFGLPVAAGLAAGLAANMVLAYIVGKIGSKLSGLYFTMALIGLQSILYTMALQSSVTGGALGIAMPRRLLIPKPIQCYMGIGMVILYMAFFVYIRRSRIGTNLVALKENPELSMALGSNIIRWRVIATIMSACMASLVGAFYAFFMMSTNPEIFAGVISLKIIMVVVVGGVGNVWGPVLGSVMIILDEYVRSAMPTKFAPFSVIIYALVLIIMLMWRPDGLITVRLKNFKKMGKAEKGR